MEVRSLARFLHHLSYFLFTLLLGIFFLSILAKEKPRKVLNIILFFYPLLLLPPLVSYFILGKPEPYGYLSPDEFLNNFLIFFLPLTNKLLEFIVEGILMCSLAAIYIFQKTKSVARTLAAFLVIYFILSFLATPSLYIPSEVLTTHEGYSLIYLSLLTLTSFLLLWKTSSKKFFSLIKNFRWIKTSHFLLLVLLGSLLVPDKIDLVILLSTILAAFFLRQFSIIVNDISDLEIDKISNKDRPLVKGILGRGEFLDLGLLFLLLSLAYTLLINPLALLLVLFSLLLIFLYSLPPFHLRKTIFSTSVIGISSSLAFIFGYISQDSELGTTLLPLTILLFLSISLAGVIKDKKDFQGDKKAQVKTIYTLFNPAKAKKISLLFIAIAFLLPLSLFHHRYDFLVIPTTTFLATLDFQKNENHERILFYAFLLFLYCFLRLKFSG